MIKVYLRNGNIVEVEGGMRGEFVRNTKTVYCEELIETTLNIRSGKEYSSDVVASFKSDEVLGFTVELEDTDNPEE